MATVATRTTLQDCGAVGDRLIPASSMQNLTEDRLGISDDRFIT
jgi:hypothetical protein